MLMTYTRFTYHTKRKPKAAHNSKKASQKQTTAEKKASQKQPTAAKSQARSSQDEGQDEGSNSHFQATEIKLKA